MKSTALFMVMLTGVVFAVPATAQPPATGTPAATVKAVQPGLLEVTGPRVSEAVAAGIQHIKATPGKGARAIEVRSPWGNIYTAWPKDVKQVAFTIETGKGGGATISAPGFTEANKADYKAAVDAVIPKAIKDAQAQKDAKSMKP